MDSSSLVSDAQMREFSGAKAELEGPDAVSELIPVITDATAEQEALGTVVVDPIQSKNSDNKGSYIIYNIYREINIL